jgi:lipoprotein-releasing system ATP-binding protein
MAEGLVSVEHIAKVYPDETNRVEVLSDVTFSLAQAEMVALVGESGAGKTTLLQIVGGLDTADDGRVVIEERELGTMGAKELATFRSSFIGFVFQFHHLLPDFTALENTYMPGLIAGKSRGECAERARELLDAVGLAKRLSHFPSELSGGERQRVALARALFNRPALVLADEPTGNLDPNTGRHLLELIQKMNQDFRQTFLVATHNEKLARGLGRTLYLSEGRIFDGKHRDRAAGSAEAADRT